MAGDTAPIEDRLDVRGIIGRRAHILNGRSGGPPLGRSARIVRGPSREDDQSKTGEDGRHNETNQARQHGQALKSIASSMVRPARPAD